MSRRVCEVQELVSIPKGQWICITVCCATKDTKPPQPWVGLWWCPGSSPHGQKSWHRRRQHWPPSDGQWCCLSPERRLHHWYPTPTRWGPGYTSYAPVIHVSWCVNQSNRCPSNRGWCFFLFGVSFPKCICIISMKIGHGKPQPFLLKHEVVSLPGTGGPDATPGQTSPLPQRSAAKDDPNPAISLPFPEIQPCFPSSPETVLVVGGDVVVVASPHAGLAGPGAGLGGQRQPCPPAGSTLAPGSKGR